MAVNRDSLDEILAKMYIEDGLTESEAKQALHQWALDEVIGVDEKKKGWYSHDFDTGRRVHHTSNQSTIRNRLRAEQRAKLKGDIDE